MRPLTRKSEFNLNSQRASASSSASSTTSLANQKLKPVQITSKVQPSTSTAVKQESIKSCNHECSKAVNFQPIVSEISSPVRTFSQISLHEAMESTHTGGRIIPSRDGVRARIRKVLRYHGLPLVAGAVFGTAIGAIGVGAYEEVVFRKNNQSSTATATDTTTTTTTTMQSVDNDEITNQI